MNVKILHSWLKEYLETDATPQKIAEVMSLTSVGIERIEEYKGDYVYDVEVTTNRPDLMSVIGLAREAAVALTQHGMKASFKEVEPALPKTVQQSNYITFVHDSKLVRRLCAVKMDISLSESPAYMKDRLESSGIRSLNNVIDITNFVMRLTGHPTHVFDYDRLTTKKLVIRESKKGETLTTLDDKTYKLSGGDIVGDNGKGEIIDLLGIMGTENSVVTENTKTIMFFIDNLDPHRIRKTSMSLGIRTEAAILNEKDIDVSLTEKALKYGVALFKQYANATNVSEVIDVISEPPVNRTIQLEYKKLKEVMGVDIPAETAKTILEKLGFEVKFASERFTVEIPSLRKDLEIPEDLIEEVARIYGYHNIPSKLPPLADTATAHIVDTFYWENRVKEAMKYWGFTEVYTYAMVSENLFEGELSDAVTIKNPLNDDLAYMRRTLVPSLLQSVAENKTREVIKIFEIANIYQKRQGDLPNEKSHFAGVMKQTNLSFFTVKGIFEQLAADLGIHNLNFKPVHDGSSGAEMYIGADKLGMIEILDKDTIDFECNFSVIAHHATVKKTYTPLAKYPPVIEDMTFVLPENVTLGEVEKVIKEQSDLIASLTLIDRYQNTRTFRIHYQHQEKNLTTEDITPIREKIAKALQQKLHVMQK